MKSDELTNEIMKRLKNYASLTNLNMKKSVRAAGNFARKEISQTAPKDTGAYAKSWSTKTTKETAETLEIVVYSKNRYRLAHLLEFGHAKRNGGRVAARPHIKTAEEKAIKQLEEDIKKVIS